MNNIGLQLSIHGFIDGIVNCAEDPSCWPLSREEQAAFVRRTIYEARLIANSEPYMAETVQLKAEALAHHTKARPRK